MAAAADNSKDSGVNPIDVVVEIVPAPVEILPVVDIEGVKNSGATCCCADDRKLYLLLLVIVLVIFFKTEQFCLEFFFLPQEVEVMMRKIQRSLVL